MNQQTEIKVREHGEKLQRIFNLKGDAVLLCKRLRRLENIATRNSTKYANAEIDTVLFEKCLSECQKRLNELLNLDGRDIPVFINTDPRGYALKIDGDYALLDNDRLPRDWGGYWLIAPELIQ